MPTYQFLDCYAIQKLRETCFASREPTASTGDFTEIVLQYSENPYPDSQNRLWSVGQKVFAQPTKTTCGFRVLIDQDSKFCKLLFLNHFKKVMGHPILSHKWDTLYCPI